MLRQCEWIWCGNCERCYRPTEARKGPSGARMCPYPRCYGSVAKDGFDWEEARVLVPGIVYPQLPEQGTFYSIPEERLWLLVGPLCA